MMNSTSRFQHLLPWMEFTRSLPMLFVVPFAIGSLLTVQVAQAGDHCCSECGCKQRTTKVCQLVCEEKKITKTAYGIAEEDFCIPEPSTPLFENHAQLPTCDPKNKDDAKVKSTPMSFFWFTWSPGNCGEVHTKKKLMKKTITKTIPSFRWKVVDLCEECNSKVKPLEVPADAKVPKPPSGIPQAGTTR